MSATPTPRQPSLDVYDGVLLLGVLLVVIGAGMVYLPAAPVVLGASLIALVVWERWPASTPKAGE